MTTIGLILYAMGTLIGFGALLYDLTLALRGKTTITDWATAKPAREWCLIAAVALGAVGFAVHLLTF